MITGLVIGKFYPPHKGHEYLIQKGLKQSDQLHLILCYRENEKPDGPTRIKWIEEMYPDLVCHLIHDDNYPETSELWAELTVECLGFAPNKVFTSENYGKKYSEILGAKHISVDHKRITVPISGTMVRNKPLRYWNFISEPLREWYALRVVIIGPESTGKTTLCERLAKKFDAVWVPEVGRDVTNDKLQSDEYKWESIDFDNIAEKQNARENEMARKSNGIVICDTNSYATWHWHRRYMNHDRDEVLKIYQQHPYKPCIWFVTKPDIPFVQDGTRDGEHYRWTMFGDMIDDLQKRGEHYIVLDGNYDNRWIVSSTIINGIIHNYV